MSRNLPLYCRLRAVTFLLLLPIVIGACSSNSSSADTLHNEFKILDVEKDELRLRSASDSGIGGEYRYRLLSNHMGRPNPRSKLVAEINAEKDPAARKLLVELLTQRDNDLASANMDAALKLLDLGKRIEAERLITEALCLPVEPMPTSGVTSSENLPPMYWSVIPFAEAPLLANMRTSTEFIDEQPAGTGIEPRILDDDISPSDVQKQMNDLVRSYLEEVRILKSSDILFTGDHAFFVASTEPLDALLSALIMNYEDVEHYDIRIMIAGLETEDLRRAFSEYISDKVELLEIRPESREILDELARQGAAPHRFMPRLTLLPGQLGQVSILNEIAYVADYEFIQVKDGMVADPIIETLKDGVISTVGVIPMKNGKALLSVNSSINSVIRPMRQISIRVRSDASNVTIQLPESVVSKIATTEVVKIGSSYVLSKRLSYRRNSEAYEALVFVEIKRTPIHGKRDK